MILYRVTSAEEARLIDRYSMDKEGKDSNKLMEKAGKSVADAAFESCQIHHINRSQLFCGKGNNGGDGAVAARELFLRGISVDVFMMSLPEEYKGSAAWHVQKMIQAGVKPIIIKDAAHLQQYLSPNTVWIDALLGTGLRNTVQGLLKDILDTLCSHHTKQPVIAVDIPSGLDGTNGHPLGPVLKANKTVTMGFYKAGLFLNEGKYLCGEVLLTDLGYSSEALNQASQTYLCTDDVVHHLMMPVRGIDHKYSRGQAVCIGGNRAMPGAIALASLSALRSGAGIVRTLIPQGVAPVLHILAPEILCHSGNKDWLSPEDFSLWTSLKERTRAVLIGPGMGRHKDSATFLRNLIQDLSIPAVVDADALILLTLEEIQKITTPLILTPHEREFLTLTNLSSQELYSDPVKILRKATQAVGHVVHLKGSTSMTGFPDGRVFIHPTGHPGMATAGSGDVLGGIITSFLAQKFSPEAAVLCGAHFHGLAGQKAGEEKGARGIIASDLIHALPEVIKIYEIIE